MASSIRLKNDSSTEFEIVHEDGSSAKRIASADMTVAVDTIADFPVIASDGDVVIVRDLNRGGTFIYDSAEVVNSNEGTNFNGWIRQYDGAVNVKWFGAKGVTGVDDRLAIIAALAVNKQVFFPKGTYEVSSTIVTQVLDIIGEFAQDSSEIKYTGTTGALFEIDGYRTTGIYNSVKQIGFTGTGKTYDATALFFKNDSAEDVDAFVSKCNIQNFSKAIHIKGRGLFVDDCTFAGLNFCFYFDRNDPVIEGPNLDQKIATGWRAFSFTNNRFHGLGGGVILDNTNPSNSNRNTLRGVLFNDNYMDTTAVIAKGSFAETTISGNTSIYGGSSVIPFQLEGSDVWTSVSITSNTFTSSSGIEYGSILSFEDTTTAYGLNISNNSISRVKDSVFKFGTLTTSTISQNTMRDICTNAATTLSYPILINGASVRNTMIGNVLEFPAVDASNLTYAFTFNGSFDYTIINSNVMNLSVIEETNKSNGVLNSLVKKDVSFQTSDVTRNDTNADDQLLISLDYAKKSPSSKLIVSFSGKVIGNNGIESFGDIKIFIDDTWTDLNHGYFQTVGGEIIAQSIAHSFSVSSCSNIKVYLSDGTSNPVDLTAKAGAILTVEEIEL
ncbi:MAG: hypothetical protein U9O94_05360 [Nanoarchaeota archaeon]|nr:hypothetical protein [Nanoarchaeota archaeon]